MNTFETSNLNESQKAFCTLPINDSIRLLAPAGSGKTYSILWRCKYIQEMCGKENLATPKFLILTFTRTARDELKSRVKTKEEFTSLDGKVTINTLNAWGWSQMQSASRPPKLHIGKKERKNLVLYDLDSICKRYDKISKCLEDKKKSHSAAAKIIDMIDLLKSLSFTHKIDTYEKFNSHWQYLVDLGMGSYLATNLIQPLNSLGIIDSSKSSIAEDIYKHFFKFWQKAVERLKEMHKFTMEDQKYWSNMMLTEQLGEKIPQGITKYTHIFVDEVQDINPLDLELLKSIKKHHSQSSSTSITIVGDDDQAIFGWRSSTPNFILEPNKYFEDDFTTCILNTNYRSAKNIVEISKNLISHNTIREPKEMFSANDYNAHIEIISGGDVSDSTERVIALINDLKNQDDIQSIALIGRKHVQLFPYQVIFSGEDTPYYVDADLDILSGEATESVCEILKLISNYRQGNHGNYPIDDILTICDKVKVSPLKKIERLAVEKFLESKNPTNLMDALNYMITEFPNKIKNLKSTTFFAPIVLLMRQETVYDTIDVLMNEFKGLSKNYPKSEELDVWYKEPPFYRLSQLSKKYSDDFTKFIKDIEKARRQASVIREIGRNDEDNIFDYAQSAPIHLLTATRSKGKEFDAVIILDSNEDTWPMPQAETLAQTEEERRLFYVAITRARKNLYFICNDTINSINTQQTQYLSEMGLSH